MHSVGCMGESVGALSWLYGRVSRCSQWFVWESQYTLSWLYTGESVVLSVVCMGESVDALR